MFALKLNIMKWLLNVIKRSCLLINNIINIILSLIIIKLIVDYGHGLNQSKRK